MGKFGFYLPRTLSEAIESIGNDERRDANMQDRTDSPAGIPLERRITKNTDGDHATPDLPIPASTRRVYRIGGSLIQDRNSGMVTPFESSTPNRTIRFPDELVSN